jgi:hypothetical protein
VYSVYNAFIFYLVLLGIMEQQAADGELLGHLFKKIPPPPFLERRSNKEEIQLK